MQSVHLHLGELRVLRDIALEIESGQVAQPALRERPYL
jgi:hypothetical protein